MAREYLVHAAGHILFSFTRSVAEGFGDSEESATSPDASVGYDPTLSTGLEWYSQGDKEYIYQEYSVTHRATHVGVLAYGSLNARLISACSIEEDEHTQGLIQQDRAMAWKQLRPSVFHTLWTSLLIGALISLLSATLVGTTYLVITYLSYKTARNCEFHQRETIPIAVQWIRATAVVISTSFMYVGLYLMVLLLFKPFQLRGVKRRLFLVFFVAYSLDAGYVIVLQARGISHSTQTPLKILPQRILFVLFYCFHGFLLTKHFSSTSRKRRLSLFLQLTMPSVFPIFLAMLIAHLVYPLYNRQGEEEKLSIAVFAPLSAVLVKAMSRVCTQRLVHITHPRTAFVLLAQLYCGSALIFRILQADLGQLRSVALLGVIHGVVEVVERSTMAFRDHLYDQIRERRSAPWGSYRTPRTERINADIAIMSMLYESSAVVSVNGLVCLFKLIYLRNSSWVELLHSFAITTSVPLFIEWFFTGVSLAIETHCQNMPVIAIWRRRWKRHLLVAITCVVPVSIWTSGVFLTVLQARFITPFQFSSLLQNTTCKLPFT